MPQVAARLLRPIKASLSSSLPPSKPPRFVLAVPWIKGLEPRQLTRPATFDCKFLVRRFFDAKNLCGRGGKVGLGSVFGVSLVVGAVISRPHVTYSLDDDDTVMHIEHEDLEGASNEDDGWKVFWTFVGRFWLPVFFLLTVLSNLDQPMQLVMKLILLLLSTKPSPLSVYLFLEQMRRRGSLQEPDNSMLKSLYASKVDVEDYRFLCLAHVEMRDQKLTLIGILGGWWKLPISPGIGALMVATLYQHIYQ